MNRFNTTQAQRDSEREEQIWAAAFASLCVRLNGHRTTKDFALVCKAEADRAVELFRLLCED